jgi:hypothetical protein
MTFPKPNLMPHLGRAGTLPCSCNHTGICPVCQIHKAVSNLEEAYFDDIKRAQAVHELVRALKEAAK